MDPYTVLGVSRSATTEEVRAAFRTKAREHHPDRNPDDGDAQRRFQEINSAFQLLSDPQKRDAFDRFGSDAMPRAQRGAASFNIEDLFSDLFGQSGRARSTRVSVDVQRLVELTFEESARGCTKSVAYERLDHCARCQGSGATLGSRLAVCQTCRGEGQVAARAGFFGAAVAMPCPDCAGRGRTAVEPCMDCHGKGLAPKRRTVDVTVPPGIESGACQSVSGGGNRPAPSHPPGDLILLIAVKPHAQFRREGDEVISRLSVPFTVAALGGQLQVDTVHGSATLTIPPGTQAGATLSLKDHGMPHRFRRGRGEHVFEIDLRVPVNPSARARELIAEFGLALDESDGASLFSSLKSWFG